MITYVTFSDNGKEKKNLKICYDYGNEPMTSIFDCILLHALLHSGKSNAVLEYVNMLISSCDCNDLIHYVEMFQHFNKHAM